MYSITIFRFSTKCSGYMAAFIFITFHTTCARIFLLSFRENNVAVKLVGNKSEIENHYIHFTCTYQKYFVAESVRSMNEIFHFKLKRNKVEISHIQIELQCIQRKNSNTRIEQVLEKQKKNQN